MAKSMTLAELLASPDPPDLISVLGKPRGSHITMGGDYRNSDAIKLRLGIAYLTWQWQEGSDVSRVVSVRPIAWYERYKRRA